MIEVGIFHTGGTDLPIKQLDSGMKVIDADLGESHQSAQRVTVAQVRQGVLADKLGFDYFWMAEHHFMPEGTEFSPNPILTQTAIAALTKRIRLGQGANIITWWHPVRIAEQAAMLDIISGGRLEFGIGRGYQSREVETFGWAYGSTVQDQEKNRSYFEEAFDIILKCWTEGSFQYRGEFYSIPPSYTKWNHAQTLAYFSQPSVGRSVEDVVKLGSADLSGGPEVLATTTTLKEISVLPQPLQKPYPQMYEPVTSERSIRWAAAHGLNGFCIVEPNSRLKRNIEIYMDEASRHAWPDRLGRGEFKSGWDCERRRGIMTGRWIHVEDKNIGDIRKAGFGLEFSWDWFKPFGFAAVLADAGEAPPTGRITIDQLRDKEVAIHGSKDYVIETILKMRDVYPDDMYLNAVFEHAGLSSGEIEEQMQLFAEEIMPVLRQECGGAPVFPESTAELDAEPRVWPTPEPR